MCSLLPSLNVNTNWMDLSCQEFSAFGQGPTPSTPTTSSIHGQEKSEERNPYNVIQRFNTFGMPMDYINTDDRSNSSSSANVIASTDDTSQTLSQPLGSVLASTSSAGSSPSTLVVFNPNNAHHRRSRTERTHNSREGREQLRERRERRYTEAQGNLLEAFRNSDLGLEEDDADVTMMGKGSREGSPEKRNIKDRVTKIRAMKNALVMLEKSKKESLDKLEKAKSAPGSGSGSGEEGDTTVHANGNDLDKEAYESRRKERWMEERRLQWIEETKEKVEREIRVLEGSVVDETDKCSTSARKASTSPFGVTSNPIALGNPNNFPNSISRSTSAPASSSSQQPRAERINQNLARFFNSSPTKTPLSPVSPSLSLLSPTLTYRSSLVPVGRHSRENSHISNGQRKKQKRNGRSQSSNDLSSMTMSVSTSRTSVPNFDSYSSYKMNPKRMTMNDVEPMKLRVMAEEEISRAVVEGLKKGYRNGNWFEGDAHSRSASASAERSPGGETFAKIPASVSEPQSNQGVHDLENIDRAPLASPAPSSVSHSPSSATASLDLETPVTLFSGPLPAIEDVEDVDVEKTPIPATKVYDGGKGKGKGIQAEVQPRGFLSGFVDSEENDVFNPSPLASHGDESGTATIYRRLTSDPGDLIKFLGDDEKVELPEYAKALLDLLDEAPPDFSKTLTPERGRARGRRSLSSDWSVLARMTSNNQALTNGSSKSNTTSAIPSIPKLPPIVSTPFGSPSHSPLHSRNNSPCSRPRSKSRSPSPAPRPVSPLELLKPKPSLDFDYSHPRSESPRKLKEKASFSRGTMLTVPEDDRFVVPTSFTSTCDTNHSGQDGSSHEAEEHSRQVSRLSQPPDPPSTPKRSSSRMSNMSWTPSRKSVHSSAAASSAHGDHSVSASSPLKNGSSVPSASLARPTTLRKTPSVMSFSHKLRRGLSKGIFLSTSPKKGASVIVEDE
ncbi:hypothetical protein D9758_012252 [Tetrapyrgos nigripes]|uniref:Uncharacterized protein n=1 Tax=Tetrapyrgos nigripes TaxID=182062 RepID=A0A8H5FM50_9AGAR|nr:hypothetical protein D9758_012252 [Tetrapyrgos nigripes]